MNKVFLLTIGMFALGFDAYVIAGLVPDIGKTFHVNDSQTGQAVSIFTLCYAIAAPIFATLFAGKPVRKVLILALSIFSISNGASAIAPNFAVLLISRVGAGIGAGLFSPLAAAASTHLVSREKQGRALGMILGGMSMGTVIGVPVGLIIARQLGWQSTLGLVTVIGIIALIGIIILFPNFEVSAPPSLQQRFTMMTNKQVSITVTITFITSVASLGLYTYIATILQNMTTINTITPFLWAWGIGGVLGSFSIGTLIDRTGRPALLMAFILAILAISMFILPSTIKIHVIAYIPFVLWGAMGWASQAPQQHVLLSSQPDHGAAAVALNSSANYLGSAVGSILGGIAMLIGLPPAHLPFIAGFLVLVALFGQLFVILKTSKHKSKGAIIKVNKSNTNHNC